MNTKPVVPTLPSEFALSLERAADLLERAFDHLMARHPNADRALNNQRAAAERAFRQSLSASTASNDLRTLELIDLELQRRWLRLRSLMLSAELQPFDRAKPSASRWFDCLGHRQFRGAGGGGMMDFISAMKAREPSALLLARAYRLPPSANLFRTFALAPVFAARPGLSLVQYRPALLERTSGELRAMIAAHSSAYTSLEAVPVYDAVRPRLVIGTVFTACEGDATDTEFVLFDPDGVIARRGGQLNPAGSAYAFYSRSERSAFLLAPFVLELTPEEIAGIDERRATYPGDALESELRANKQRTAEGNLNESVNQTVALTPTEAHAMLSTSLELRALLRDGDADRWLIAYVCAGAQMISQSLRHVLGIPIPLHALRAELVDDLLVLHFMLACDLPADWEDEPDWDDEDSDLRLTSLLEQTEAHQAEWERAQRAAETGDDPEELELRDGSDLPWAWTVSERLEGGGHHLVMSCEFV